jgi:Fe-Mn family superoxide dismutase
MSDYSLPPLPYDYNALEPHVDEQTMRLHHDKHHQAYVDGLNNALKKLSEARASGEFGLVKHWEREVAFHGSGHFLHAMFWTNMGPKGGGEPKGPLAEQIKADFGSFDAFQKHYTAAANQVEGSGWAILGWEPLQGRLLVLQAEKHQDLTAQGIVPLLVLDVWEHAYYLRYQNRRADYTKAWWNVVNWDDVAARFASARR